MINTTLSVQHLLLSQEKTHSFQALSNALKSIKTIALQTLNIKRVSMLHIDTDIFLARFSH